MNSTSLSLPFPVFYVKGTQTAMKALLTTNESPYKMSLYMPALLNKINRVMDKFEVTVNNGRDQKLEITINDRKWTGFNIVSTGPGNERQLEINGKKFLLTENSLKTKINLAGRNWLEPKISWQGRLPNNAREAEAFLLENRLKVEARGSRRNFIADLDWKMDRPDSDFSSPWDCKMNFNIAGEEPKWGTYTISRNLTVAVDNNVIKLLVFGVASFTRGAFAKDSPVITDVDLKYEMNDRNLEGKFTKVIKGKEHTIPLYHGNYPFKNFKIIAILMNIVNFYN